MLYTDHQALLKVLKSEDVTSRISRWQLASGIPSRISWITWISIKSLRRTLSVNPGGTSHSAEIPGSGWRSIATSLVVRLTLRRQLYYRHLNISKMAFLVPSSLFRSANPPLRIQFRVRRPWKIATSAKSCTP